MANLDFPPQYTRAGNTTHNNEVHSIPQDEQFAYGTEMEEKLAPGFRFRAEKLPFIVYRCAYLASLLARRARRIRTLAKSNCPENELVRIRTVPFSNTPRTEQEQNRTVPTRTVSVSNCPELELC